ncbi:GNAT family N-acetyltransferase [Paenibacillus radicis (ex Gao et al. 2016)]|uniref:Spermidine acetyltransferase n=1 Tax=Paenibacillus radicis (ex Gao et al. 2016) TaxID=1737354 RepID=A0A917GYH7_9BACL|nr:GNAT family N-acetyltransferase [Paenibacillus radicis (ex Gao et al. 2016)]GGG61289.1 spermidine acetyltransferase [Paenibacillus radicis (ex Gao et al. 2016)]
MTRTVFSVIEEESVIIRLEQINRSNWEHCIRLKLKEEQQTFMASNLYSIAELQFLPGFKAAAVYLDDRVIGFAMYGVDPDDSNYWIYRFMIDESEQGKGYGTEAMKQLVGMIGSAFDRTDVIMLGYHPDNEGARRLYNRAGFQIEGIAPWGEELASYRF